VLCYNGVYVQSITPHMKKLKKQPQNSWLSWLLSFFSSEPQDKEELVDILDEASDRDLLDTDSSKMIKGVLKVAELSVGDVMVPRSKMVALSESMKLQVALPIITQSAHSRFPVMSDSKESVVGILLAKDILTLMGNGGHPLSGEIVNLVRPAMLIPQSKRLDTLLKEFRTKRYHMAIVVDEYGSIAGLITIEDVLEQIVGDIEDEYDLQESSANIQQITIDTFQIKAQTSINELNATLDTDFSDDEFDTVGGLVLDVLSHMPKPGETVKIAGFEVKILKTSKRRVELLEFKRQLDKMDSQ
jgi:magnesium and cobalt transporter